MKNETLQEIAGYTFSDLHYLQGALTHASKHSTQNYEISEFLGDRVLSLVISHWLIENFPESTEGEMASRHTFLVKKQALVEVAQRIDLSQYILLSKGEKNRGTHKHNTILADVMEAIIGAIFLDGGYDACVKVVKKLWEPLFHTLGHHIPQDPKSHLQEWLQSKGYVLPVYTLDHIEGPSHKPTVWVTLKVNGFQSISASGNNRKEAEQKTATMFLNYKT